MVTAVEINPKIAKVYQKFFPNDKVIVGDAHPYLLEHFEEFDFIWSSPPCPTHSRIRFMATKQEPNKETNRNQLKKKYPQMDLYQEIIFLNNYFEGKFVVENVIGYYEPLVKPQEVGKHYFWCNFPLNKIKDKSRGHHLNIRGLQERKGFNLEEEDLGHRKDQVLRNCVEPELALHIFEMAFKKPQTQLGVFERA